MATRARSARSSSPAPAPPSPCRICTEVAAGRASVLPRAGRGGKWTHFTPSKTEWNHEWTRIHTNKGKFSLFSFVSIRVHSWFNFFSSVHKRELVRFQQHLCVLLPRRKRLRRR